MTRGYKNEKMELKEVCEWLEAHGMKEVAASLFKAFEHHTWTDNGLIRKDVIADIFNASSPFLMREMECDVTTYVFFTPDSEAHVD